MNTISDDEWLAECRRTACLTLNTGAALLFEVWIQALDSEHRQTLEHALSGGAELAVEVRPALPDQPLRIAFMLIEREGTRRELASVKFAGTH